MALVLPGRSLQSYELISRADAYLAALMITTTNALAGMEEASPTNGLTIDETTVSQTDPRWIGVTVHIFKIVSWYIYLYCTCLTVHNLFSGLATHSAPDVIAPTALFFAGSLIFNVGQLFEDVGFWFAMYEGTNMSPKKDMPYEFISNGISLAVFLFGLGVLISRILVIFWSQR